MKSFTRSFGLILISLSVPFLLLMTSIRLLITPVYAQIEYRMPYFPADPYGFTLEDRLKYSQVSIDYLVNDEPLQWLADQRLPDGMPLYNERELSHMLDVKNLVQRMISAWTILVGVYLVTFAFAWRRGWLKDLLVALGRGGVWTIGFIVIMLAAVAVSFNGLFTLFHRLFFEGSTWIFLYSDSLIRLFPIPFWRDAFILVGSFTILGAILLILIGRRQRH
ncbi:MAG: TIGR01906 family membrane protein [Anaerolineae bacterium]|nr:TIGR01906 family membrane protein [Anaerolineae bacterium]